MDGFQPAAFDQTLFEHLVLKDSTKEMIKNLTEMYIRDSATQLELEDDRAVKINTVRLGVSRIHKQKQVTWSADYVQGKGDCLVFLLHGKPRVGKTYTAGMI